jgi:4-hydroxy-3-polyprenylbenzoate decarboxylase
MRVITAITGATGAIIGVKVVQALHDLNIENHLIVSRWGRVTLEHETNVTVSELGALAHQVYGPGDVTAPIASGSFPVDAMVVVPCSMKTLAAIRCGYGEGLIPRAADVTLKERRRLILVPRELPLSEIHLENMLALARMGVTIAAPVPAFYNRPSTIDDVVMHIVYRLLDQLGIRHPDAHSWNGALARASEAS